MWQWLIPECPRGCPLHPPVLLSPPHHHLHRWVLLFPHRIRIMGIEGFQRGWFTPLTPAPGFNSIMMQVVAEGGSYKQTHNSECKQTFCRMFKCFLLNSRRATMFPMKPKHDSFEIKQLKQNRCTLLWKHCFHRIRWGSNKNLEFTCVSCSQKQRNRALIVRTHDKQAEKCYSSF